MPCNHDDLREIRTVYDRSTGILVFFWTCASCGERLDEVRREAYRPQFDPNGNSRFLAEVR